MIKFCTTLVGQKIKKANKIPNFEIHILFVKVSKNDDFANCIIMLNTRIVIIKNPSLRLKFSRLIKSLFLVDDKRSMAEMDKMPIEMNNVSLFNLLFV